MNKLQKILFAIIYSATFVLLFQIDYHTTQAELVTSPANTVSLLYRLVQLNCTSNYTTSENIEWTFTPYNNDTQIVLGKCAGANTTTTDGIFEFDSPEEGTCNLMIYNVTVEEAGTYSCITQSDEPALADLIVIDYNPKCAVNGNPVHRSQILYTFYSQTMEHICWMNFTGSNNFMPTMNWTTIANTLLDGSQYLGIDYLISYQEVKIQSLESGVVAVTYFVQNQDLNGSLPLGLNPEPPAYLDTFIIIYDRINYPTGCGGCSCWWCIVPVAIASVIGAVLLSLIIFCVAKRIHRKTDTETYVHGDDNIYVHDVESKM